MKWFLLLMTIAIWQCIQVTGNSVSQRKSRSPINLLFPIEYPSSRYRNEVPKEVYLFLPFYRGFRRATRKKPEHATKGKSNDKEREPTSHIQKKENDTEIMDVKREDYHVNDKVWENYVNHVKELQAYLKEKEEEYRRLEDNNRTSLGELVIRAVLLGY